MTSIWPIKVISNSGKECMPAVVTFVLYWYCLHGCVQIKTMKSTDSSRSLMNYIADFIEGKEEYKNIFFELVGLDRAAQGTDCLCVC